MRVILAFFLGILVIIGGAFYHDATLPEATKLTKRLVNWDNVGDFARASVDRAREEFNKLTSR